MSVADWHDRLLSMALEARKTIPDFRFNLRTREDDRLLRGYWFLGNDDYLFFPPFRPNDWMNKTRTVGFSVGFDDLGEPKSCLISLTFRSITDARERKAYKRMEAELGGFKPKKGPDDLKRHYLGADPEMHFQDFLTKDYPRLRKIIREEGLENEFLVSENEFTSMLRRVEQVRRPNTTS
jgi:hypothetical protein